MSPTFEAFKFENIVSSESDLEEGEIPDVEFSKTPLEDGEIVDVQSQTPKQCKVGRWPKFKTKSVNGYFYDGKKAGLQKDPKDIAVISSISSSDGEYISDIGSEGKHSSNYNIEKKVSEQPRKRLSTYGKVRDLMTQIDELAVPTKCKVNYKRRRSKESKRKTTWCQKSRSSKVSRSQHGSGNHCKYHRRSSSSESESDSLFIESRKSAKIKKTSSNSSIKISKGRTREIINLYSDEESVSPKRKQAVQERRDFDEYRKKLLAKLKNQKCDDDAKNKGTCQSIPLPCKETEAAGDNDIQEYEMADDSNMFVDECPDSQTQEAPPETGPKNFMDAFYVTRDISQVPQKKDLAKENEGGDEDDDDDEEDGDVDDDTELIQLRLLALTSNRKNKDFSPDKNMVFKEQLPTEEGAKSTEQASEENTTSKDEEADDETFRNELLLRAEALKTAVIKNHQRRLNKNQVKHPSEKKDPPASEMSSVDESEKSSVPDIVEIDTTALLNHEKSESFPVKINDNGEISHSVKGLVNGKVLRSRPKVPVHVNTNAFFIQNAAKRLFNSALLARKSPSNAPSKKGVEPRPFLDRPRKVLTSSQIRRRRLKRLRWKEQKKKKNLDCVNKFLKENSDQSSERIDEDDEQLRLQLLNDLNLRKTQKETERKSVLIDSQQTTNIIPDKSEVKPVELKKPVTTEGNKALRKPLPAANIERIIVHLGADSSDDETTESDKKESSKESTSIVSNNVGPSIIDYEKSVEFLLRQARENAEKNKGVSQTEINMATPEAVYKHLPLSQRLEYARLKQKIAEREKMKKAVAQKAPPPLSSPNTSVSTSVKSDPMTATKSLVTESQTPQKVVSSSNISKPNVALPAMSNQSVQASHSRHPVIAHIPYSSKIQITRHLQANSLRKNVPVPAPPSSNVAKNNLSLSNNVTKIEERKKRFVQNQLNISKLKVLLKNIKIEKTIEERYEKEIKRLKDQVILLEKKRAQHRVKILKMADDSKKIYELIQLGRNIKNGNVACKENLTAVGESSSKKNGGEEEKPTPGEEKKITEKATKEEPENASNEELQGEKAADVKMEVKNEKPEDGKNLTCEMNIGVAADENEKESESENNNATMHMNPEFEKYDSPLGIFAKGNVTEDKKIDPNTMMCQFDLLGVCRDEECPYQHYRTS